MASPQSPRKSIDNVSLLSAGSRSEAPPFGGGRMPHGHRPRSRRGSTASSIRSIAGTLDSSTSGWASAVHESGQNAISTLLQPPIVRTGLQPYTSASASGVHKPPTARDIPPVTLTNIPQVDASEFGSYISQFGALYDQLRRIKDHDADSANQTRSNEQDDHLESGTDGYLRPATKPGMGRKGSTASLSSLNSIDMPAPLRRASSSFRKSAQGPPPLSTIPNVYFEEEFHLENPRTFDVVSERSEVIPPTSSAKAESNGNHNAPRKALATNAILQEKLSWYMDTIEIHLINSISTASTTFFTALGSLKELHSEAADSVTRIKALRQELETLDEEIATTGLHIVQKRRRQENLQQLNDAVKQLRQIVQGVGHCESLVDAGELDKALGGIDSLEKLIAGEQHDDKDGSGERLRDLRAASALQGVNADLATLRFRIGKAYEAQFMNVLVNDLRKHTDSVSSQEVLMRWSNAASRARGGSHARSPSVFPAYLTGTEELKAQLLASMTGMQRAQHIATAAAAYRDVILREIRNLIRRPLPSSNDDDNESMMSVSTSGGRHLSNHEKSSILARNLRALEPEDGEELFIKIYVGVTETLRRLTTQVKVLLDIASSLSETSNLEGTKSPSVRSPLSSPRPDRHAGNFPAPNIELQEELHKALDITTLLSQAVDVAIDKIVKVLKVRSEQATRLPLRMFLRYFTLNLYFTNECEAISGRSGTSLKTVVNNHIKEFVQRNGDAATQKLAQEMESDQWKEKDFTEKDSRVLQRILECSTHDAAEWAETQIWVPSQELFKEAEESEGQSEANGAGKEKARTATIDEETFVLPNPAILCLYGIEQFLHLIAGIPSMTADVGTSLVAYLQLFNSRCTQLILGAGATKTAGLRNITTKHLALASQALSFIATLIPHVREFVRRHGSSAAGVSNLMGEFDRVRRLLQEHQNSIHQKLVQIMEGRATIHAKTMKNLDWDSGASNVPNAYMETLAKETTTLYRALTKILPDTSIPIIMHPVFTSYKDQLGTAFTEANPKTKVGQDRMLRDVEHFTVKLGKIDGFGTAGDYLSGIIMSKKVKSEEASSSPHAQEEPKEDAAAEKGPSSEDSTEKEGQS